MADQSGSKPQQRPSTPPQQSTPRPTTPRPANPAPRPAPPVRQPITESDDNFSGGERRDISGGHYGGLRKGPQTVNEVKPNNPWPQTAPQDNKGGGKPGK